MNIPLKPVLKWVVEETLILLLLSFLLRMYYLDPLAYAIEGVVSSQLSMDQGQITLQDGSLVSNSTVIKSEHRVVELCGCLKY
jgi:hypothetical protein